jgi:hypothetical protein
MKTEETEDDKLNEIAPTLSKMSRQHPFIAPDGYFDSLPTIISERITAEKEKPFWVTWRTIVLRPRLTAALVSVLMVAGAWWYFSNRTGNNQNGSEEIAVTYADIVESGIFYEWDELLLVEELAANSTDEPESTDMENYLIENETDINNLINEL